MTKVLGIIPARAGSKRIPGKNMKPLHGKPLISYALQASLYSKLLDHIIVTSDSSDILDYAQSIDKRIVTLLRPDQMSTDESPAIEYVEHALEFSELNLSFVPEYVAIIQVTSPFTIAEDIDATIQACIDKKALSAASVMEVDHHLHPSKFKRLEGQQLINYFPEISDQMSALLLDKIYVRNGSVYVSSMQAIKNRNLMMEPCVAHIMPAQRSLDINDLVDFKFAEFLLQQNLAG
jgi:CMP-N,N'-diacetyllegionaminic acid synthase